MHRRRWSGGVALAGLLLAQPAGAAGCADDLAARTSGVSVSETLGAYAACIAELSTRIDQLTAAAPVPAGTVAAFDLTGCPDGWEPFAAAQGRVVVGASFGTDPGPGLRTDAAGKPVAEYKYREHGGVETVTLNGAQMPLHRHGVSDAYHSEAESHIRYWVNPMPGGLSIESLPGGVGSKGDVDKSGRVAIARKVETGAAGGETPVDNMPPFIALHFCKKG